MRVRRRVLGGAQVLIVSTSLLWTGLGWGAPKEKGEDRKLRAKPYEACLTQAAIEYRLPLPLLTAIVHVENGYWNPLAISINRNGKGIAQSVKSDQEARALVTRLWLQNVNFDVGLGQVNTVNMERLRVHPVTLLNPCINLSYSARILRESIDRHGYNWTAVERYNGINPSYPWKVKRILDLLR